ncbi:MAG: metallophosphoesterase [Tissierellia bacterium]|nr:metallophosphoesterase [Tissierellia bacterium]
MWLFGIKRPIDRLNITINTKKIVNSLRLCILSDTHSSNFGHKQQDLIKLIRQARPDMILMPGDIYDDIRDNQATDELLPQLPAIAPVFYSSGNHDIQSDRYSAIPNQLAEYGIEFMDGKTRAVRLKDQTIVLSGIIDPARSMSLFRRQLSGLPVTSDYHIVMSHRPQFVEHYANSGADLVVSGHAHGGQWRLFGRGVFAPEQGVFPKFTRGLYPLGKTQLVVSPGLMRNHLPRFFNRPTIVVIDIRGDK